MTQKSKVVTGEAQVGGNLDIRYLKAGQYTLIIPVPDEIAELIGRIVIQWGAFELRMDLMIETILPRLHKAEPPGWRRMNFKTRKRLFKDLMTDYTGQLFPSETEAFRSIADKSGDLHWRRNIVAHGYIKTHLKLAPDGSPTQDAEFVATGSRNGRNVTIPLDIDTLQKLRHDIGHLGGNLMAAINRMGGRLEGATPEIVVPDIDFVQGPQSGSFRTLAMTNKSESPPGSSGA